MEDDALNMGIKKFLIAYVFNRLSLRHQEYLKSFYQESRQTPMKKVIKKIKKKESMEKLHALEVFGQDGSWHTKDYAPEVASLEIWEIDPRFEQSLRTNFPMAQIKITDSFQKIHHTSKKFSLIVVDNPMSNYGEYCEHFELFPDIFEIADASCILILNIIPSIDKNAKQKYSYLFNKKQLTKRKKFYKTIDPEHISFENMVKVYEDFGMSSGYTLDWFFYQKRSVVYYLVLKFREVSLK